MTPEQLAEIRECLRVAQFVRRDWVSELLIQRDALVAAGDVLATRLDETPAIRALDGRLREDAIQRQQAVRAWLAIAHPQGEGHKP
jgi:hypothetical protein